jgi:hypothetical protein
MKQAAQGMTDGGREQRYWTARLHRPVTGFLVDAQERPVQPVAELPPPRWVDAWAVQRGQGEPPCRRRLVVRRGLAGAGADEQDLLILLARLAVGVVADDVAWVGLDSEQPDYIDDDACLLADFPDGAPRDGLAEFLRAHRDSPLGGTPAGLEHEPSLAVDGGGGDGDGDQAVPLGHGRVAALRVLLARDEALSAGAAG